MWLKRNIYQEIIAINEYNKTQPTGLGTLIASEKERLTNQQNLFSFKNLLCDPTGNRTPVDGMRIRRPNR